MRLLSSAGSIRAVESVSIKDCRLAMSTEVIENSDDMLEAEDSTNPSKIPDDSEQSLTSSCTAAGDLPLETFDSSL